MLSYHTSKYDFSKQFLMCVSDSHESERSAVWHENLETKSYTASINVPKVVRVWRQYVKLSTQSSRLSILSRCVSRRQQENSLKEHSPSSEILQCNYKSVVRCCGLPSGLAHLQRTDFSTYFLTSIIGQCPTHQFYSLLQINEAMTLLTVSLSSYAMAQRSLCRARYKYSNNTAWQAAWLRVIKCSEGH